MATALLLKADIPVHLKSAQREELPSPPSQFPSQSAHRELQQLERIEVLHAAAHALGRVEQHVGLRRVGIAQHGYACTVHHEIATVEIAECNRKRICRDVG